jgi:hypothetical protein
MYRDKSQCFGSVLDPDSAFYLNADQDHDSRSQTNVESFGSGSWSEFAVIKSWILT